MPARSPRWALMRLQMTRLHVARCLLCTCIRFRSGGAASRRGHSSQAANGRRWRPATSRKQQRCCPRPQVHQQRPSASKQRKLRRARTQEALVLLWRIWTLDRACWMAAATAVTFNSNNKSPPPSQHKLSSERERHLLLCNRLSSPSKPEVIPLAPINWKEAARRKKKKKKKRKKRKEKEKISIFVLPSFVLSLFPVLEGACDCFEE